MTSKAGLHSVLYLIYKGLINRYFMKLSDWTVKDSTISLDNLDY